LVEYHDQSRPVGFGDLHITNFSSSSFNLAISDISNTTATSPDINARLVSFGFGLTPNATGFSNIVDGSVYSWGFSNFPGFQSVDVCGFAGINCAGGSNAGLNQGESVLATDIMSITILEVSPTAFCSSPFRRGSRPTSAPSISTAPSRDV
jgi:hypothetical protein